MRPFIILPSTLRTPATYNTVIPPCPFAGNAGPTGIVLSLNVSALTGGTTLTLSLEAQDAVSGLWVALGTMSSLNNAIGSRIITMAPGLTTVAQTAFSAAVPNMPLRTSEVVATATNITYSLTGLYF